MTADNTFTPSTTVPAMQIVGHCPQCGAPIYSDFPGAACRYTCACRYRSPAWYIPCPWDQPRYPWPWDTTPTITCRAGG